MALDFNQRSYTKSVDQAAIDEGLRAYMLKVYNYMTIGLLLTGFIAYFFGKASIVTNEMGQIVGVTQVGACCRNNIKSCSRFYPSTYLLQEDTFTFKNRL